MKAIIHQRYWIYLLTALLLSMQSLAIWHDAEHPYHATSEQCERLESISHTPTLDVVASIPLQFITHTCVVEPILSVAFVSTALRDHHNIRAPPHSS